MSKVKIRCEVVLTDADVDIIEAIEASGLQRATFFKVAARAYLQHKDEERFDVRVKRLLTEVLADRGEVVSSPKKIESKTRVGFGAKKV